MDVTQVLSRLSKVRKSGKGWLACCPAHQDRSPSMSVTEGRSGILLYCFAGCDTKAICEAIAIDVKDLFYGSSEYKSPPRKELTPMDVLRGLYSEVGIIAIIASDIADGKKISKADADRGMTAAGRILAAVEFINERR